MNIRSSRLCRPCKLSLPPVRLIALVLASWLAACRLSVVALLLVVEDGCDAEATAFVLLFAWMLHTALSPKANIFAIAGTTLLQSGKTTDSPLGAVPDPEYGGPKMTRLIEFGFRLRAKFINLNTSVNCISVLTYPFKSFAIAGNLPTISGLL